MTAVGPYSLPTIQCHEDCYQPMGKLTSCGNLLYMISRLFPGYFAIIKKAGLERYYSTEGGSTVFVLCKVVSDPYNHCKSTTCKGTILPDALSAERGILLPTLSSHNLVIERMGDMVYVDNVPVSGSILCTNGIIYF